MKKRNNNNNATQNIVKRKKIDLLLVKPISHTVNTHCKKKKAEHQIQV